MTSQAGAVEKQKKRKDEIKKENKVNIKDKNIYKEKVSMYYVKPDWLFCGFLKPV
jgi:hypothetical protein